MNGPLPRLAVVVVLTVTAAPAAAQLDLQWMIPASAHTAGLNGTFWRTDLSLHNPQAFDLPVEIQFLPSGVDNRTAETLYLTLYPYETFNLWDVLGPDYFDVHGSGALLVFADWSLPCEPVEECDFLATSRTYTHNPAGGVGEYGQTIPAAAPWQGVGWNTLGYVAGVLNDGVRFRTNIGVASWSGADGEWTRVAVDVQDADGAIVERLSIDVPPFGHVQRRLQTPIEGGSLVFWISSGPDDPLIFGYASVVDEATGDSSFQLAQPSVVGFAAKDFDQARRRRATPDARPVGAAERSAHRAGSTAPAEPGS